MKTTIYLLVLSLAACSSYPHVEPNCARSSDELYAEGVRLLADAPLNVDQRKGLEFLDRERRSHRETCGR